MAVITISRQCGAGGKTLCKMIADKFGYTLADSEIIKMVAEMGDDGDVVILGRGSQYILNDHPDAYQMVGSRLARVCGEFFPFCDH
jgi:cytidylate kinase